MLVRAKDTRTQRGIMKWRQKEHTTNKFSSTISLLVEAVITRWESIHIITVLLELSGHLIVRNVSKKERKTEREGKQKQRSKNKKSEELTGQVGEK